MTWEDALADQRPPVSEAVVELTEETSQPSIPITRDDDFRWGGAYLVPLAFCAIAFGLIAAVVLTGISLSIIGQ